MVFLATVDPSPRLQPMKFPVFSQLAGNLAIQRRVRAPSTITPEPTPSSATAGVYLASGAPVLEWTAKIPHATGSPPVHHVRFAPSALAPRGIQAVPFLFSPRMQVMHPLRLKTPMLMRRSG
jgi:hypothetical protein